MKTISLAFLFLCFATAASAEVTCHVDNITITENEEGISARGMDLDMASVQKLRIDNSASKLLFGEIPGAEETIVYLLGANESEVRHLFVIKDSCGEVIRKLYMKGDDLITCE